MEEWFSDMEISIKNARLDGAPKRTEKNTFKKRKTFDSQ
jgi:hypothetical protein